MLTTKHPNTFSRCRNRDKWRFICSQTGAKPVTIQFSCRGL